MLVFGLADIKNANMLLHLWVSLNFSGVPFFPGRLYSSLYFCKLGTDSDYRAQICRAVITVRPAWASFITRSVLQWR